MTSFRSRHQQVLSTGVVVERLPLGYAAGRWWATFVYSMPDAGGLPGEWSKLGRTAWVHDPGGRLDPVSGSGGGSHLEQEHTWELVDHGASRAHVSYVEDDVEVGSEVLTLDPSDRVGYAAVRLGDGSLVERLLVGRAHGRWHLRWVRSDVPAAEAEAAGDDLTLPHHRFVRLRASDGPLRGDVGPCTIGGAIHWFGLEVPDTVTHLEVDYLFENDVVTSEVVPLPALDG